MSVTDPAELKRKLRAAGFEIYRTAENQVKLAERVRDNLIMDSGVAAVFTSSTKLGVRVIIRAQASHFPGATEDQLWEQARTLAREFLENGYLEEETNTEAVADPSDPARSLDTSHEISLHRGVESLDLLCDQLRLALGRRRSTSDD